MAWNIPARTFLQPEGEIGRDSDGATTRTVVYKGPFSALQSAAAALAPGDTIIEGWVFSAYTVEPRPAGSGILRISCLPAAASSGGGEDGGETPVEPVSDIWSVRTMRNDINIFAYCGPDLRNPQRALIEAWLKEPDGDIARKHQYKKPDGSIVQLTTEAATMDLVMKIEKGVESVARFYPVVTRTRRYSTVPPACLENISFIDTPAPSGADAAGGLASAIAAHSWMKCQDDIQKCDDGSWTRTEGWMGIPSADGEGWDADLYGPQRWTMPYQH